MTTEGPPGTPDDSEEEPTEALLLDIWKLRRRLRTIQAERDSWMTEALALRARLGVPPDPPNLWKRTLPGFRRVWPEDN